MTRSMNCFATITVLLVSLSVSACSPDDYDLPAAPPTQQPGGGSDTDDPETPDTPPSTNNTMTLTIGNTSFTATLAASPAVDAFRAMLPLALEMSDFNDNEKVAALPGSLPTAASNPGTIRAGDILLYGSNSLVLFYETFSTSYSYTRIGRIDQAAGLKAALGTGNITITFEIHENQ